VPQAAGELAPTGGTIVGRAWFEQPLERGGTTVGLVLTLATRKGNQRQRTEYHYDDQRTDVSADEASSLQSVGRLR
jgi:hypothetical protein